MESLFQLGVFIVLITLGFVFGRIAEAKHYKSIQGRESELRGLWVLNEKFPPPDHINCDTLLVTGSVVISVDYFKTVISGLKTLVGGRLTAYESLIDRARREAILRMQQEAKTLGADMVINLRFETSQISGNNARGIGSIEVLAYGTALVSR